MGGEGGGQGREGGGGNLFPYHAKLIQSLIE